MNYIGVTESEVSYNPFAYCENEPMNCADYWGYSSYRIFKVGTSWKNVLESLLKSTVMYKNRNYYPSSATVYQKSQKVVMLFGAYTNSRTYLKKRAQEIYFYKTYVDWCYYICVENKNLIVKYRNKIFRQAVKILRKLNKNLTQNQAEIRIEKRIDEIENVVVPTIDECFCLNIGFVLDVISIASDLIDVYYKKFSKEVKYISKILESIGSKYQNSKYVIFIPYYIYYDNQVFYEVNFGRTGVKWLRNKTYKFF